MASSLMLVQLATKENKWVNILHWRFFSSMELVANSAIEINSRKKKIYHVIAFTTRTHLIILLDHNMNIIINIDGVNVINAKSTMSLKLTPIPMHAEIQIFL